MAISRSIVEAVRTLDPPGRFLDKDPVTGRWSEVGHKKAVEKTSQALRDGAASLRKQLSADLGDPDFLNAVFHADDEEMDTTGSGDAKANKTSSSSPKQIKKETVDGGSTTTEDGRKVDDSSVTPTVVSADHLKSSKEKTKTTIKAKKLKVRYMKGLLLLLPDHCIFLTCVSFCCCFVIEGEGSTRQGKERP